MASNSLGKGKKRAVRSVVRFISPKSLKSSKGKKSEDPSEDNGGDVEAEFLEDEYVEAVGLEDARWSAACYNIIESSTLTTAELVQNVLQVEYLVDASKGFPFLNTVDPRDVSFLPIYACDLL